MFTCDATRTPFATVICIQASTPSTNAISLCTNEKQNKSCAIPHNFSRSKEQESKVSSWPLTEMDCLSSWWNVPSTRGGCWWIPDYLKGHSGETVSMQVLPQMESEPDGRLVVHSGRVEICCMNILLLNTPVAKENKIRFLSGCCALRFSGPYTYCCTHIYTETVYMHKYNMAPYNCRTSRFYPHCLEICYIIFFWNGYAPPDAHLFHYVRFVYAYY